MIQNVLRSIGGIGVYDTISIVLFVIIFCGGLLWAVCLKKPFVQKMSALPLEENERNTTSKGDSSHD